MEEESHGMTPQDVVRVTEAIREALDGQCLTRTELAEAVATKMGSTELAGKMLSGWGSILKPASFQGHLCFGPNRGRNVTFRRPDQIRKWDQVPEEEALKEVARKFLRSYGPATHAEFSRWLGGRARPGRETFASLTAELQAVNVEGHRCWILADDLGVVTEQRELDSVILLGLFDPYTVMVSPHAKHVIPYADYRSFVYRTAGWIAPVILVNGRIVGTWNHRRTKRSTHIECRPAKKLPAMTKRRVESAAVRIGRLLGGDPEIEFARP